MAKITPLKPGTSSVTGAPPDAHIPHINILRKLAAAGLIACACTLARLGGLATPSKKTLHCPWTHLSRPSHISKAKAPSRGF